MQVYGIYNQPTFGTLKGSKLKITDKSTMYGASDFGKKAISTVQARALQKIARTIKTDDNIIEALIGLVTREYDLDFHLVKRHHVRISGVIGGENITIDKRNMAPTDDVLTHPFEILSGQLEKLKKFSDVLDVKA